jgi:hypothetical protein
LVYGENVYDINFYFVDDNVDEIFIILWNHTADSLMVNKNNENIVWCRGFMMNIWIYKFYEWVSDC